MSRKPEQYYERSYLYPVLSAAAQSMLKTAGTWDICSPSQKAEILEVMEQHTAAVIEAMAENLAQHKRIEERNS
jgi:hypothetical protein